MIIIPDIHGRTFWRKAVEGRENEEIVFLGDYNDPYPGENIKPGDHTLKNFEDIVDFKRKHPDTVTLLVGNHDQHYFIADSGQGGRYSWAYARKYYKVFNENRHLFRIAVRKVLGGKEYVFSHAGIIDKWVKEYLVHAKGDICDYLNNLYLTDSYYIGGALGCVSKYRGGFWDFGSCTWADIKEHFLNEGKIAGAYQIFGHTKCNKYPIITDKFACLDVRRAFKLGMDGIIREMDDSPAITWEEVKKKLDTDDQ